MKKYRISFIGRPIGRLSVRTEHVTRFVRAENAKAAALKAYDTHEHIYPEVQVTIPEKDSQQ